MIEKTMASLAPLSSQGAAAGSVISQAVSSAVMCCVRASLRSTRGTRSRPSSVVHDHRDDALHEADHDRRQAGQAEDHDQQRIEREDRDRVPGGEQQIQRLAQLRAPGGSASRRPPRRPSPSTFAIMRVGQRSCNGAVERAGRQQTSPGR